MNEEIVTIIVKAVVGVCTVLITGYLIPWLKSRLTEDGLNYVKEFVEFAVRQAEQYYNSDEGQKKKAFVTDYIRAKFPNISDKDIDAIIEAVVNEVHHD